MTAQELKILSYIREGKCNLVDFADSMSISAPAANNIAEKLEQEGYIVRKSYTGIDSFTYLLTDKGVNELPELSAEEAKYIEAGICKNQYIILAYLAGVEKVVPGQIVKEADLNGPEIVADVSHLVEKGLVADSGQIRRYISITEAGRNLLKKIG